ncbi:trypsin-like peptidase domain-containing protein [Oceanimonas sp. CHS3-5]|uniref:trypsin-like peptidase domain-containing protein n=1 Tax=Oceanimonas sp. CHS3-5 TaxID=3068186 RepID=UPI00273EA5DC|nr:trypsin-like peptidase domain-containing protein [Oceanimonas sp. CHS3-5]MDP5293666.1 trypsin-like peptidase domain-containing protein [Oceanimonas sp. CHS3-5]
MKPCLPLLLMSLLLAGCGMSAGQQQQAAYAARLSGDDTTAFDYYREAAASAEQPEARYQLAQMYLEGRGTAQNTAEAIDWLTRLSDSGEPKWQSRAHRLLGEIYAGEHDPAVRDARQAAQHFAACAALGDDDCVRRQALLTPPRLQLVSGPGPAVTAAGLYDQRGPAVYKVVVYEQLGAGLEPLSLGSAVAIDPYRAVTSYHLVAEGGVPVSISRNGQQPVREADIMVWRVLYTDAARDLALLTLEDGRRLEYTQRARSVEQLQVGDRVFAIGSPAGLDKTLTEGIVSARRNQQGVRVIQTTAPISYGSSGGGLFDESGNLVGITTKGVTAWGNFNFAVAADEVQAFLAESAAPQ